VASCYAVKTLFLGVKDKCIAYPLRAVKKALIYGLISGGRNPGSISPGLTWGENTRRTRYSVSCLPGGVRRLPVSRPMAVRLSETSGI